MKKIMIVLAAVAMAFAVTSCSNGENYEISLKTATTSAELKSNLSTTQLVDWSDTSSATLAASYFADLGDTTDVFNRTQLKITVAAGTATGAASYVSFALKSNTTGWPLLAGKVYDSSTSKEATLNSYGYITAKGSYYVVLTDADIANLKTSGLVIQGVGCDISSVTYTYIAD